MDYVINTDDLCKMVDSSVSYRTKLESAVQKTISAIDTLYSSDLIDGVAAQALKNYYHEVHAAMLAPAILTTYQKLSMQLVNYYARYQESPIAESGKAILPSEEIVSLKKRSEKFKERLSPIDSQVSQALRLVSRAQCSVLHPTMKKANPALESVRSGLEKLDTNINDAEGWGLSNFANDAEYKDVVSKLNSAIASAAKIIPSTYVGGSFFQLDGMQDLSNTLMVYQDQWNATSKKRIEIENHAMARVNVIRQAEYERKATWKRFWDEIGTGFAVAGLLVGAAALIVTTGPVSFGIGALLLSKKAYDVGDRIFGSISSEDGSPAKNLDDIIKDSVDDGKKDFAKETFKGMAKEWDNAHDGDMTNQYEAHGSFVSGLVSSAGGSYVGMVSEGVTYHVTGDARLAEFEGDVASDSVSTAIEAKLTDAFDSFDAVSFGLSMGTIVADYGSDVCAADMAEISEKMDNTNKLIEKNSRFAPQAFTFGVNVGAA